MERNNNIINARNKFIIILCVFIFVQICFLFAVDSIIERFFVELQLPENLEPIIKCITYFVIVSLGCILDTFFAIRTLKLQKLSHIEPIFGIIEDIVVYSYRGRNSERKYKAYLIVKEKDSGKLLFTYGKYSLSFYNYTVTGANQKLVDATIFRKDGSVVKIGDSARIYKKKIVNVDVKIDDKIVKLNNKSFRFYNMNPDCTKDIFAELDFYEGAIDVELT